MNANVSSTKAMEKISAALADIQALGNWPIRNINFVEVPECKRGIYVEGTTVLYNKSFVEESSYYWLRQLLAELIIPAMERAMRNDLKKISEGYRQKQLAERNKTV
jgi:hypothetical protein